MRAFRKLVFLTFVTIVVTICVIRYNDLTDGFTIWQIRSSLGKLPQFTIHYTQEEKANAERILSQEFQYLGKGCQSYAFESIDGEYILKFFKNKHLKQALWMPFGSKVALRRQRRVEELFTSCKIAAECIPEETGLLYVQLSKIEGLNKKVTLIDKRGAPLKINLKEFEFCLQRKGTPLTEVILQMNCDELNKLKEAIAISVRQRCQKGVRDNDPAVVQNVALKGNQALWIDTGQLSLDPKLKETHFQELEVECRLHSLNQWLQIHSN